MSEATCVNLLERFGRRYRIGFDPSYNPKHRQRANLDPWMMTIVCQRGTIYPHGGDMLAVEIDGRPMTVNKLLKSGVCRLSQDGDHEKTLLFNVADLAMVAKIVKPRKRRQISDAERQRLKALSAQHGLQSQTHQPKRSLDAVTGDSVSA